MVFEIARRLSTGRAAPRAHRRPAITRCGQATARAYAGRAPWLLGERFSAADVLWGGALNYGLMFKLVPDWPVFLDYARRVQARPAIRRAVEMDDALAAAQARELDEALAA